MYNFDKEMFPSLINSDIFVGGYNSIGMADLSSKEQVALQQFFDALGEPIEEFDADDVLLVKADAEGIPTVVYGAAIFRTDEEKPSLVLKCGKNIWPVKQDKATLICGSLSGEISWAEKAVDVEIEDGKGEKISVQYWGANVAFLYIPTNDNGETDEDNAVEYRVRCKWDVKTEPKPPTLKAKMNAGKPIVGYFSKIPSGGGGGEVIGMQTLGVGRFEIESVRSVDVVTDTYKGKRYILKLTNGVEVWTRGNAEIVLKDRAGSNEPLLTPGRISTLIISDCKQRGDGKWSVTCAIRESKPEGTIAPPAEPIPVTPVAAAVEPATPAVDYDTIPF